MVSSRMWWCVVLIASSVASAQARRPTVMPYPLELERSPSLTPQDGEALQREYKRVLRLAGAALPDFAHYDRALAELRRQDCEDEDICLVELAHKADALYGLYAKLDLSLNGDVVATGRVVRRDGKVVSRTQAVTIAAGARPFSEAAVAALSELFSVLKLGELPPERPVDAPVADPTLAGQAPSSVRVEASPARPVAVTAALVAVGAGGAALALALTNLREASALSAASRGGLLPGAQVDRAVALDERTAVAVALGVGAGLAAAVAIGALLWKDAPVQLAPSAQPGRAGLTLVGRLP